MRKRELDRKRYRERKREERGHWEICCKYQNSRNRFSNSLIGFFSIGCVKRAYVLLMDVNFCYCINWLVNHHLMSKHAFAQMPERYVRTISVCAKLNKFHQLAKVNFKMEMWVSSAKWQKMDRKQFQMEFRISKTVSILYLWFANFYLTRLNRSLNLNLSFSVSEERQKKEYFFLQ